ncbi:MAG: imelysin family protein [Cellvibrionaceae bacterium]
MNRSTQTFSQPQRTTLVGVLFLAVLGLSACDNQGADTAPPHTAAPATADAEDPVLAQTSAGVWLRGIAILEASLAEAQILADAVQALLDNPTEDNLNTARLAWRRSHDAYNEFDLFTALGDSNPGLFGTMMEYDFPVDAWPIQPGYLDYYDVYTHSGIVNDIAMPLTADTLRQQHGFTDTSDVSLGFHALEYLLWGENGERSVDDYSQATLDSAQQSADLRPVDLPNNRRRTLLTLLVNLLVDDIERFKQAVENPSGLLRGSYLSLQPASRLALMQGAGHTLLNRHRDQLQAQLGPSEGATPEQSEGLIHNPFAGGIPNALAHSLLTLEEVLLSENGFGEWAIDDEEQRTIAQEKLAQLRVQLLSWNDQAWPPEEEQAAAIIETLTELAELFAPEHL